MKIVSKHPLLVGTAVLTLVSAGLYGCKDFLSANAKSQGTLDESTLSTKTGVEGTLIGAYRALDCTSAFSPNWGCAASNWVWGSVLADDAYKGSDSGDQPAINELEGYHWGLPHAQEYLDAKWGISYEGVVRANSALRLLKNVLASSPGAFSVADAHSVEGEAIFLRAHYHFEAWRMWGNIPYFREDETDFRKPNETSAEVVADILKDLDSAIKLLPVTPRSKGRAGQWTAKAYKGRVQVYAGQYGAAQTTLQDVRNNGPYALETSFDHVWTGFGFNQPSVNLVNYFKVDATGLPLAITSPTTWNSSNATLAAGNMTPVDPRLDWTVGRQGVPYKDWGTVDTATWVRDISNGGPYSPKKNAHEDASGAESTTGWVPTQLNSVNIHLYRYADLLLLLAEADVEQGNLPEALTIVNQIRARAAVTAQGCGVTAKKENDVVANYPQCAGDARIAVPINDPKITWALYRVNPYPAFPSQAYAREAVRAERRLEMAMEGQRFFDLRRWGLAYAAAALNGYLTGEGGGAEQDRRPYKKFVEPFASKHLLFPIPIVQLELSNLKQNTGW